MKSILSLLLCLAINSVLLAQTTQPTINHSVFDQLLQKVVHNERVDYLGIIKQGKANLASYLNAMALVDVETLGRNDQLAYYINVYNATMIQAVVDRYHKGYSPAENDFQVFKDKLVRLKTGKVSLNDLENKIIRPTFKDPRIHVALVCGAVSCPPLLNRAYVGASLNIVLDNKMKRWLNDEPTRNRIDVKNQTLYLSQIFKWYPDDFGGKNKISTYVAKYNKHAAKSFKTTFIAYDWTLNIK